MNTWIKKLIQAGVLLTLLSVGFVTVEAGEHGQASTMPETNLAIQFVDAYNQHDVTAMLSLVSEDIRYMYISHQEIYVETKDKQALASFLPTFFKQQPAVRSQVLANSQNGPFITQVEQAMWTTADGRAKSQCSLSVYQIKAQKIINIWYHDAYACP